MNRLQIDLNKIYPGADLAQLIEIMTAVQDDLLQYDEETHVSEIVDLAEANTSSYLRLWGSALDNPEATVGYRLGNVECDLNSLDDDYQLSLIQEAEAEQQAEADHQTVLQRVHDILEAKGPMNSKELKKAYLAKYGSQEQPAKPARKRAKAKRSKLKIVG